MKPSLFQLLSLAVCSALAFGCSAMPMAEAPPKSPHASQPVLDRSLFSKDTAGSVSESDLQHILDARVEVPSSLRVGVVVLDEAFKAEKGASISEQNIVAAEVSRAIARSDRFAQVTDVSTDLPNPQGLEGLRTIAARYRLRHLLLINAKTEDQSHLNNWAWLYPTVVGIFAAPGVTVQSQGMIQASLLDVRTGIVLFTVNQPFDASGVTWAIGSGRHHEQIQSEAMRQAAGKLAHAVVVETNRVTNWAKQEAADAAKSASSQK